VEICGDGYPIQPPGIGLIVGTKLGERGGLAGVVRLGVKVGRGVGVGVGVGVGDTYQRSVGVGVRVGGMTAVGVINTSGGYSSSMADCQFIPPVETNSLKRVPG